MTTIEVVLIVGLVLVVLPWTVFQSVKRGTYAFYRGRELFQKHEETRNGKETKT